VQGARICGLVDKADDRTFLAQLISIEELKPITHGLEVSRASIKGSKDRIS